MKEAICTKHGATKDAEPCFMPDARGLLVVAECKRRLSEEQGALVNLHAQRELKLQSAGFERLTYPKDKNCLRYHLFFTFYEKPETLMQRVSIGTDSLTAKREVINN